MAMMTNGLLRGAVAILSLIVLTTPAWSSGDSRLNRYFRGELRGQGFPDPVINRFLSFYQGFPDDVLHPAGLVESSGGYGGSYQGRAVTLYAVRLYNDTGVAVCVRAKGGLISGPMMGTRSGGSIGYNFLLESGSSESVVAHMANRDVPGVNTTSIGYYFWLPDPNPRADRRCSSVAPADVERWAATPSPVTVKFDPALARALRR